MAKTKRKKITKFSDSMYRKTKIDPYKRKSKSKLNDQVRKGNWDEEEDAC